MGINIYASLVGTKAKQVATAVATVDLPPVPGKRPVIMAYSITPGATAGAVFIMSPLAEASINGTGGASNLTSIIVTPLLPTSLTGTAFPTTASTVVVELDDGTYQWATISTSTTTTLSLSSALTDDASAGNKVWYMGLPSSLGTQTAHPKLVLASGTAKSALLETGIFYGNFKGGPMRVHVDFIGSIAAYIDYISYAYVNV